MNKYYFVDQNILINLHKKNYNDLSDVNNKLINRVSDTL